MRIDAVEKKQIQNDPAFFSHHTETSKTCGGDCLFGQTVS
jgi:hypothetical protein